MIFAIIRKEFNGFLYSLIAYLVIGVFLFVTGLYTWVFQESSVLESGFANLDSLFGIGPFVFMFLIPAITMRSFSEEMKNGTLEWLLTKPITIRSLIIGKYLAALLLTLFSLVPTFIYFYSIIQLGNPVGNADIAGIMGSYLGLALLASVFVAVGIFSSSLTENQIVSFIISIAICFTLYSGLSSIAMLLEDSPMIQSLISYTGIEMHYLSMSRGLIDSRDMIYFLSLIIGFLAATHWWIQTKRTT